MRDHLKHGSNDMRKRSIGWILAFAAIAYSISIFNAVIKMLNGLI